MAARTIVEGRDIPGDWWTLFGSQELVGLVNEALRAAQAYANERMGRATGGVDLGAFGGLGLPGL